MAGLLAREGWALGLLDLSGDEFERAVAGLRQAGAREVTGYRGDVAAPGFVADAIEDFATRLGGLVLNVASSAGFAAAPQMAAYNVTKAGVIALSETLASELAGTGVQVSVARPGFFRTHLLDHMRAPPEENRLAHQLMDHSGHDPDEAAAALLGAAAAGTLASANAWTLFGILFFWQFPHAMAIAWLYRDQFALADVRVATVADPSGRTAAILSVLGATALVPVSLVPLATGDAGWIYAAVATLLAGSYLAASIGFFRSTDDHSARRLLRSSIIYLPGASLALLGAALV
jgi:NAD(P)-dependent dehydrogenase (short-subunit alcohol dehydrogenase family)